MKFYPGDFMQDTITLSLRSTGAWIKILCAMWRQSERGKLTLSVTEYCRLLSAPEAETLDVIDELGKTGISDTVTDANKNITLICRRMAREFKTHKNNALRQERFRVTHDSNASVTGEKSEVRSQKSEVRGGEEAAATPGGIAELTDKTIGAHKDFSALNRMAIENAIKSVPIEAARAGVSDFCRAVANALAPPQYPLKMLAAYLDTAARGGKREGRKLYPSEIMRLLDEARSQAERLWNKHEVLGKLPDQVKPQYRVLQDKIKELEKKAMEI